MINSILDRIENMGKAKVSMQEIDLLVDDCISFLKKQQDEDPQLDLSNDLFDLEEARQQAMVSWYLDEK